MKGIAKGVCDAVEITGFDCNWRATQALLICLIAILIVMLVTWLGTKYRIFRKGLDGLYFLGGVISAVFMLAMLGIIVAQMIARWSSVAFPGSTNYAGYCMAASSFFALAYALNSGSHIRVNIMLSALGKRRVWGEFWCFGIGAILATYFARYAVKGTQVSAKINDISQGQDAMQLWIPQVAMAAGTILLAIAVWDNFFRLIFERKTNFTEENVSDDTLSVEA